MGERGEKKEKKKKEAGVKGEDLSGKKQMTLTQRAHREVSKKLKPTEQKSSERGGGGGASGRDRTFPQAD